MDSSAIDTIARFYDLDLDGFDDDLAMYQGFADAAAGPILELGCGTGRVTGALAGSGHAVIGVDASPNMLEQARRKHPDVRFIQADFTELDMHERFDLVIAPLGSFLHLKPADRAEAFFVVDRHLNMEGRFVADLPLETEWAPGAQPVLGQWTRRDADGDRTISKLVSAEADVTTLTRHLTWFFDEQLPDGAIRRSTAAFDLSYFTENEVRLLIEGAGMRCEGIYGGYDLEGLRPDSQRMIVVAFGMSARKTTVALDAMGADHGPETVVKGAIAAASVGVRVLIVGPQSQLNHLLEVHRRPENVAVIPAEELIRRRRGAGAGRA